MTIKSHGISLLINGEKIISHLDLEIIPGQITAILGPNGAGKSTALKILAGDIQPSYGDVKYNNINLLEIPIVERARFRSVMSQSQTVAFDFTTLEIIEMGWIHENNESYSFSYSDALEEIINICDLHSLLFRKFNTLSGGEQKRVNFARILLQLWIPKIDNYSRYLLLDEPFTNLDIFHELKMLKIIKSYLSKNVGILIVLHDLNIARKLADNVTLMRDGRTIRQGPTDEVFQEELLSKTFNTCVKVNDTSPKITFF